MLLSSLKIILKHTPGYVKNSAHSLVTTRPLLFKYTRNLKKIRLYNTDINMKAATLRRPSRKLHGAGHHNQNGVCEGESSVCFVESRDRFTSYSPTNVTN